jgi:hypothetical protein
MTTAQVVILIIIVVLLLAALVVGLRIARRKQQTSQLRGQFGPEYDATVGARGNREAAERELAERQSRRAEIQLRELEPQRREELSTEWQQVQARFVDEPVLATSEAHVLVRRVLSERGYPTQDLDSQTDLVSVDHPEVVGDYREAVRRTQAGEKGEATTEDLREAMVHYRSLFSRLLGTGDGPGTRGTGEDTAARRTGDDTAARRTGDDTAARRTGDDTAARGTGDDTATRGTGDDNATRGTGDDNATRGTGDDGGATDSGNIPRS